MQRDLFDDPPHDAFARHTDPDTSHAAAASMSPEEIAKVEDIIWKFLYMRPGLGGTQDEVCDGCDLPVQTATPRWKPMILKKRIERRIDPKTGKELKRRGRSGRGQKVHFAIGEPK